MLKLEKIKEQVAKHQGMEIQASLINQALTAILFEDNSKILKQELIGNSAPVLTSKLTDTPAGGAFIDFTVAGSNVSVRVGLARTENEHAYRLGQIVQ